MNKTDGNPPLPLSTYIPAGGEAENKRDKLVEDTISEMVLSTTEKDRAAREGGRQEGRVSSGRDSLRRGPLSKPGGG